ncbi:hypothetical protein KIL84_004684 [Mauremys mutica]|uniref:Uncharacterized protein n=1 Tax=Mauremys mutica TaxID=74926 RepID=A0A9D4B088_9SAUR|nr:hypothetical protein KIL84_004684 [Mauremys mutica]
MLGWLVLTQGEPKPIYFPPCHLGEGDRTADLAPEPGSKLIADLHRDRTQQRAHVPRPRHRSPQGGSPMEDVVNCSERLSQADVLRKKNELEAKGLVTEGLAACFSRAMELLKSRQPVWMWLGQGGRLILQSDGCWVEFRMGNAQPSPILLVWYDPHRKEVQVSPP